MIHHTSFLPVMESMVRSGQTVPLLLAGNSMVPFLRNGQDTVFVSPPDGPFRRGDLVFYTRPSGQYVMHRIYHIRNGMLFIVGDAHTEVEGPVDPDRVFGVVREVLRKGKALRRGSLCWWFFEQVWIRMVPLRPLAFRCYGLVSRLWKH